MYHPNHDTLVELENVPQSSVGAPQPVVISDEFVLLLAYDVEDEPSFERGHVLTEAGMEKFAPYVALIEFQHYASFNFGSPNDETLHGRRLHERGLRPYGAFEVKGSSWMKELDRINSVHHSYKPGRSESQHHYIFTFHDSTFECVAGGYHVSEHRKSISELLPTMIERLMSGA